MSAVLAVLRGIPAWLRLTLLIVWLVLAVGFWLLFVFGVDLDYEAIKDGLVYAAGYLVLQSGANVTPDEPVLDDPQYELDYEE